MARTKRRDAAAWPVNEAKASPSVWKTAGYIRLSLEDSGRPGAETMESQRRMVSAFIEEAPDLELTELFCDNGRTGTDFDRPAFEQLMTAIRAGKVNCIVVKDLSRFGRNYKETGNYLERIFPFLGVRFIAVTDNFDTLTAERNEFGFIIPLKNLIKNIHRLGKVIHEFSPNRQSNVN